MLTMMMMMRRRRMMIMIMIMMISMAKFTNLKPTTRIELWI